MTSRVDQAKKLKKIPAAEGARPDWEKMLELAEKLAEHKQFKQAEDLCYSVLLNFESRGRMDGVVSSAIAKVSRMRQKDIYPEHYILK